MSDSFDISKEDIKPTSTSGVFRVEPSPKFREWIAHQKLILIVAPEKEIYAEWKHLATEKPDGWHAKVLALPENQDLFVGLD